MLKMSPLNLLQIAIKNNIDIMYFAVNIPYHVLFVEDGQMGESLQTSSLKLL